MNFIIFIASAIYFIIPCLSNSAPVLFRKLNFLNYPVDFNKKLNSKPIFGKNKTFRGFFFGILTGIVIVGIQTLLYQFPVFKIISLIPYNQINFVLLGFLYGFGCLFGDLVESFVKRRFNIKPGGIFFPWDQLDLLIGALIFVSITYVPPIEIIVFLIIAVPIFHIAFNYLGYYLGLQKEKW